MTLAGSSDITIAITEPQTGRKEMTLPIKVTASTGCMSPVKSTDLDLDDSVFRLADSMLIKFCIA